MQFVSLIVKEVREETGDYRSIIFDKPPGFAFQLGECFSLRFPDLDDTRVFSFASSPTEKEIIISYKKGRTEFKKKLESVVVGDQMEVSLYGSQFRFNPEKESVFIAGGIGITAFRSIIKFCIDNNLQKNIHLIFINRVEEFPFQKELETFKYSLPSLTITYISTQNEGRLTKERITNLLGHLRNQIYIAGPPLMIDDTVSLLFSLGIPQTHIHTESFDGYTEEN